MDALTSYGAVRFAFAFRAQAKANKKLVAETI
jgi:hypothetical protein